jgi:hypothetical protein
VPAWAEESGHCFLGLTLAQLVLRADLWYASRGIRRSSDYWVTDTMGHSLTHELPNASFFSSFFVFSGFSIYADSDGGGSSTDPTDTLQPFFPNGRQFEQARSRMSSADF